MHKYLLFLIFIIAPTALFSQQFEGGFFGGLSASQVDGDRFSGYNKVGITAGAYFTRKINRKVNWKTEIRYIQKGAYEKSTEINPTFFKTSLHYAEIPMLAQYFYNNKIYLEAGLVPEILLASKEENEDGIIPADQSKPFHRFTLEASAGAGYFLTNNIAAGFRYTYSVLTARDHASGQTYMFNRGQYNNVLSFTIYYHFR
jgi:opacity protein-like surface antigen